MELVRGDTLDEWIEKNLDAWSLDLVLGLFNPICAAVSYAHQRGVIHRDLKPQNIHVSGSPSIDPLPEVKVLDFGLARISDPTPHMASVVTDLGRMQGSVSYMSPEQARGNPPTKWICVPTYIRWA